jgi:hypothetical protein
MRMPQHGYPRRNGWSKTQSEMLPDAEPLHGDVVIQRISQPNLNK